MGLTARILVQLTGSTRNLLRRNIRQRAVRYAGGDAREEPHRTVGLRQVDVPQVAEPMNDDVQLAQRVLDEDDRLDDLKTQIFRELLTYMLQDPSTIEPALDLVLVSRHLERIGDHATNVAEDVIFIVSARDVRHHA